MRASLWCLPAAIVATVLSGCVGNLAAVAPQLPQHYTEAGPTHGSACGFLFLDLIPIAVNDRVERAYAEARNKANAEAVTDTTIEESWYFALIGTVMCTEIDGQAIRAAD